MGMKLEEKHGCGSFDVRCPFHHLEFMAPADLPTWVVDELRIGQLARLYLIETVVEQII